MIRSPTARSPTDPWAYRFCTPHTRCILQRTVFAATLSAVAGVLLVLSGPSALGQDKTIDKVMAALPDKAPAEPKAKRKLLIYSKTLGFRHGSIGIGTKAIAMMGDKTGAY